jgi:hypothetical protein
MRNKRRNSTEQWNKNASGKKYSQQKQIHNEIADGWRRRNIHNEISVGKASGNKYTTR